MSSLRTLLFVLISFGLVPAFAQTQGISFQAVLSPPGGGANPDEQNLTVKLLILAPSLTTTHCVLRSEDHTGVDIKNGYLNLVVGGPAANPTDDGFNPATILTLAQALDNTTSRTGLRCVDGNNTVVSSNQTYAPQAGDRRLLRLVVVLTSGDEVIADFNLRAVPYAINSETLGGRSSSQFVQINTTNKVTQANLNQFFNTITAATGNSIQWNGASFVAYNPANGALLNAGSVPNSALAPIAWSKLTSVPANLDQIAGLSCVSGKILKRGATAWTCADETVPTETDPSVLAFAKNAPGAGLTVVANSLQLNFATSGSSTAGRPVEATDVRLSNARTPTAHTHTFTDLLSGAGVYMTYRPNGTNCSTGQTLKWNNNRWECGTDLVGDGGGGGGAETDPTVEAFAKQGPGTGLILNGSNALSIDFGTGAGKVVEGNDGRLSDARAPTAHSHPVNQITSGAGLYLSYRPNNAACSHGEVLKWNSIPGQWECGTDLSEGGGGGGGGDLPAGTTGHFLRYGVDSWASAELQISHVTNLQTTLAQKVDISTLPACGAGQSLTFLTPSNTWSCVNIQISATAVNDGVFDAARLPAASLAASGIVDRNEQSFAGKKIFEEIEITGPLSSTGIAHVAGLKIGVAAGLACDGTSAGVLRFNSVSSQIEFCNGTVWTEIGAGDAGGGGGGGGGSGDLPEGCLMFPPIGYPCSDGTFYAGTFRYDLRLQKRLTVVPPGCYLDEVNMVIECPENATEDTFQVPWSFVAQGANCGANDPIDGWSNRENLEPGSTCNPDPETLTLGAPIFCAMMVFDGDDRFYLPSIEELKHLLRNQQDLGGIVDGTYWSSTEGSSVGHAQAVSVSGGVLTEIANLEMTTPAYVRCLRRED